MGPKGIPGAIGARRGPPVGDPHADIEQPGVLAIVLPHLSLSHNVLLRMHYRQRAKHRDELCMWVRLAVLKAKTWPRETPAGKMQVRVDRFGPRLLDYDNFVGGCKPLLDALVLERVIRNDNPAYVEATYRQTCVTGQSRLLAPRTLVRVTKPGVTLSPLSFGPRPR